MSEKFLEPMNTARSATAFTPFPSSANLLEHLDQYTDMMQLNRLEQDWTYRFVKFLLNETEAAIDFRADFMLDEAFRRYFFEQREAAQQQGRGNFALGFPLVGKREGDSEVLTPLLIWELSLEADAERAQSWVIRQVTHQTSYFNRQLLSDIPTEVWEQLSPLVESLERKGQDSPDILARLCNQLAELTHFGLEESAISLGPVPKETFSLSSEDQLHIHWAGLFGNFQLEQYLGGESSLRLEGNDNQAPELLPVGPKILDPWQAAAFEHACVNPETRIEAPEGSGRTYLLMHMLASLIYQRQKLIILAPKLDDLTLLQEEMASVGLDAFSLLIGNGQSILSELQQKIKVLSSSARNGKYAANKDFAHLLANWQKEKEKLDQLYQASRKSSFGTFNRIDTLAFMLRSGRTEGKQLLASQLDPKDFAFSPSEMERLSVAIEGSEPLFGQIRTLAHPLNNLNAGIFLHKEKAEALSFIQETSKRYLAKATELQYAFIRELDQYSDQLMTWHNESYQVLKKHLVQLKESLETYQQQFSRDTMESAKATLKLYGAISKKFQQALAAQEDIQGLYDKLEQTSQSFGFFAHTFLEGRDRKLFQPLEENLTSYQNSLEQWRAGLNLNIQEEVARLNSKTVHAEATNRENVLKLEAQFDIFLDELNASGLYQLPVQSKTLTFPKRQRFLQDCMEQLERTRLNLRDFSVFFDWQKHWFLMPALARRIVTALVKVRPKSWLAAFESWYFEQCLTSNYQPVLHSNSEALASFVSLDEQVRKDFLVETSVSANERRQEGLKRIKQDTKALKDWLKAPEPSYEGLLDCCDQDLGVLTDIFPIILTTTVEASILFEQTQEKLDYLVYWGSSEEMTTTPHIFSQLAGRVVLFSNHQSVAAGIETNRFPLRSAYWQSVLDPAYGGSPVPAAVNYQYEFVNGRYDEVAEKNDEEAQAILQALNGITSAGEEALPSVAIVCFTKGQRNLFLTYLDQIKQQSMPGHEHVRKLEAAGLQVLHITAISKKPFDIVLVSASYGQTGVKGSFTEKISHLKAPAVNAGLQQLRNIALKECRIYHSIPETVWKQDWKFEKSPGLSLLHLYLTRIQRLAAGEELERSNAEPDKKPDTSFAKEVAWRIAPHISTDRLLLDQEWNSINLPMILLPKEEPQEAMLWMVDGFLSQNQTTNFTWEMANQQRLRDSGYDVRNLSTFDWWKQPEEQTEKLLADIRENDHPKPSQEEE